MTKYAVVDHATHNILGEYSTEAEAEALLIRLAEADERAEADLGLHTVEGAEASGTIGIVTLEHL
jgi:hypothetical protein